MNCATFVCEVLVVDPEQVQVLQQAAIVTHSQLVESYMKLNSMLDSFIDVEWVYLRMKVEMSKGFWEDKK